MISRIKKAVVRDGILLGTARILIRGLSRSFGRVNARIHGLTGLLPLGSQVSGIRYINIGTDFRFHGPAWIEAIDEYAGQTHEPEISIGQSFRASERLHITAIGRVVIGDDCLFGSSVFIGDHAHGTYRGKGASDPTTPPALRGLGNRGDVVVGSNCWIGDNVTIIGPVTIGEGCVIAANSVVTSDIPPKSIAAGSPAKVVKSYDESTRGWLKVTELRSVRPSSATPNTQEQPSSR